MEFNTLTFLLFFGLVLALHQMPVPWRWKKGQLLAASYLFYAAWNPPFVLLLIGSTLLDWTVVRALTRLPLDRYRPRRALLGLSLLGNLGLLAVFKYGDFLVVNFKALMATLGWRLDLAEPGLLLPMGISFYTFQTLSYTIDVYRGHSRGWHAFLDYALYVTFFPQLVAGPIVRSGTFLSQCLKPHRPSLDELGWGLALMTLGLFQKVVIADGMLAGIVENIYDGYGIPGLADAWLGTGAFAIQIFCDFAGYSTCAIGAALMLGFRLPQNFRFPYAAVGFSDFWRRWHISLSSWLRDYLYIPLGGNRGGAYQTHRNLVVTMLIGGLWHGASWTFVVWGGLHGFYLVAERWCQRRVGHWSLWSAPPARWVLSLFTFVLVCFAWVFFRAETFPRAFEILQGMAGAGPTDFAFHLAVAVKWEVALLVGAALGLHWLLRERSLEALTQRMGWPLRSAILAVMIVAILHTPGEDRAFIYFQF